MANISDYLAWRGDIPFSVSPFCEVDNLIFSMLSFIDYSGIVPGSATDIPVRLSEAARQYAKKYPGGKDFGPIIPEETNTLLAAAGESVRFRDVYLTSYRDEIDEARQLQFSAITFVLPDGSLFLAFRGTDDTLVGWREDFNLSFMHPVPSQTRACEYLAEVASVHRGKIRLGGHSKGGNLAAYAAITAPETVLPRILTAYSNDGPGFTEEVIASEAYARARSRIRTIVPQSSVVGMLLGKAGEYEVVESTIRNGLLQHDPFSWQVLGTKFVHLDALSESGRRHDAVFDAWLGGIGYEERRAFTDALFRVLDASGAKTVTELSTDQLSKAGAMIRAFNGLEKETKENMLTFLRKLTEANFAFRKSETI